MQTVNGGYNSTYYFNALCNVLNLGAKLVVKQHRFQKKQEKTAEHKKSITSAPASVPVNARLANLQKMYADAIAKGNKAKAAGIMATIKAVNADPRLINVVRGTAVKYTEPSRPVTHQKNDPALSQKLRGK